MVSTLHAGHFELKSPDLARSMIPPAFTCDGIDVSPSLYWRGVPHGTKSFAFIMTDPDASVGTWTHWIVYNIPSNVRTLSRDLRQLPGGAKEGENSAKDFAYDGPCPPLGVHHYVLALYALNIKLHLPAEVQRRMLKQAMRRHLLGEAEMVRSYRH
jgi:Raf kinase inhibitor-like YbhB/YbcL family protein